MYSLFTTSLAEKIESAVASTFDCHEVKFTPSLGTTDPVQSCYVLVLWYKSMAITSWSSVPITGKWGKIIFFVFLLRLHQASSLSKMDVQWNMKSPTIRRIRWWKSSVQIGSEIGCFEINYMVVYTLCSRQQVNPLTAPRWNPWIDVTAAASNTDIVDAIALACALAVMDTSINYVQSILFLGFLNVVIWRGLFVHAVMGRRLWGFHNS